MLARKYLLFLIVSCFLQIWKSEKCHKHGFFKQLLSSETLNATFKRVSSDGIFDKISIFLMRGLTDVFVFCMIEFRNEHQLFYCPDHTPITSGATWAPGPALRGRQVHICIFVVLILQVRHLKATASLTISSGPHSPENILLWVLKPDAQICYHCAKNEREENQREDGGTSERGILLLFT